MHVSEDAYKGDAQFTVAVDGKQVGGIYTATASHASEAVHDVSLSRNWGAGAHTATVNFLNDLYGGTPTMDRNLYVKGVSIDGATAPGSSAALLITGTDHFQILVPTH